MVGWSVDIPTDPSLFEVLDIASVCDHHFGDINDAEAIAHFIADQEVDTVFHLAAQPLVRLSYNKPLETLSTNVLGTANVLEAVRRVGRPCSIVSITSDKCYENGGSIWGFRECDPMGGSDPYSMSKGAAELVISSWRTSFFSSEESTIRLASARAGNVIGGGDWAADRIVTDSMKALSDGNPIKIRNPYSTRPWQHVLEPLSGYLWLGEAMATHWNGCSFDSGWNFGPAVSDVRSVRDLVDCMIHHWGSGSWADVSDRKAASEARTLSLNCDKAHQLLAWRPVWDFDRSIAATVQWYRVLEKENHGAIQDFTRHQIEEYVNDACAMELPWAAPA